MHSKNHKFKQKLTPLILSLFFSIQLSAAIQQQKLIASDGAMVDLFGTSAGLSGDYAVIGANQAEIEGDRYGAAYVFKYDGSQWQEIVKLTPPQAFENFGASVSISGDTIAIGAPNALVDNQQQAGNEPQAGVVYIYKRDVNDAWNEAHRLFPADVDGYDKFGTSISLENNQLIVGSPFDDDTFSGSGSAYIFDFDGSNWIETDKLTASNPAASDKFGHKVDINASRAVVSSPNSDDITAGDSVGTVYVFEKGATNWNETKILQASDMAEHDNFGIDISLSGDRVLVGAYGNDDTILNSGSAYIFDYNPTNTSWDTGLKLNANDPGSGDRYGGAVKINGDKVLIGAVSNDDGNALSSGSVYSYYYNGNSWDFIKLILHTDSPTRFTDAFGNAIDLDNDKAIIGSYFDDGTEGQTFNSGAAYIFDVDEKPVAVLDSLTVDEDIFSVNIDVLINDTDVDNGQKIVTDITQPNNGMTTIAINGTIVKYFPNDNYCNDGTITDDFTYTLNGGSTATVEVSVNCIDDAPIAVADTNTITEDLDVTHIQVLNNDTDVDDGTIFIESYTQASHGSVGSTAGRLSYSPDSDYCNDGNTTDDFTYTLNGGSQATVSITVICVDDLPIAVLDVVSVNEDQDFSQLDVLDNDSDVDDGPMSIIDFTQPSNGTVINYSNNMTYKPNLNYCNDGNVTDDFTYTLNGGTTTSVNMTVNCVNDAPSFDIIGDIQSNTDQNQLVLPNFTSNIIFGPNNESSQQVLHYTVTENSDSMDVIDNIEIDNIGNLTIDFSLNPGVALIDISMTDNGGTAHQGNDTSGVYTFNVTMTDLVFSDGFENTGEFFIVDYVNEINQNNSYDFPIIYDYSSHSIIANGFMLEMVDDLSISEQKQRIQLWIKELQ